MATLRMKESKFGAPVGVYVGKFLGVQPMKDDGRPRLGNDGKPMEPGMEWQWEITEGEQAGQIVGRITSQVPTTKNACGQLLMGMVGRPVAPDEEIDLDQFRGAACQIVIGPSTNDPNKTHVKQVMRQKGAAGAKPNGPGEKPPSSGKPLSSGNPAVPGKPPLPGSPPTTRAKLDAYVGWDGGEDGQGVALTPQQVQERVQEAKDAGAVPLMAPGDATWKTAKDFGFEFMPF